MRRRNFGQTSYIRLKTGRERCFEVKTWSLFREVACAQFRGCPTRSQSRTARQPRRMCLDFSLLSGALRPETRSMWNTQGELVLVGRWRYSAPALGPSDACTGIRASFGITNSSN